MSGDDQTIARVARERDEALAEVRRLQRIEKEARQVVASWREFGGDKAGPLVDALGDLLGKNCPDEDCPIPGCEDWGACSDCGWTGHGNHGCQGRPGE